MLNRLNKQRKLAVIKHIFSDNIPVSVLENRPTPSGDGYPEWLTKKYRHHNGSENQKDGDT